MELMDYNSFDRREETVKTKQSPTTLPGGAAHALNQSAEAINSDYSVEQHDQDNTGKEHKFFTLDSGPCTPPCFQVLSLSQGT
jgi:hypothetical protein